LTGIASATARRPPVIKGYTPRAARLRALAGLRGTPGGGEEASDDPQEGLGYAHQGDGSDGVVRQLLGPRRSHVLCSSRIGLARNRLWAAASRADTVAAVGRGRQRQSGPREVERAQQEGYHDDEDHGARFPALDGIVATSQG